MEQQYRKPMEQAVAIVLEHDDPPADAFHFRHQRILIFRMVQHGATTMWERWNGDQMMTDPGMNSFTHYAYGAVADWIYRYAAGIDATPLDAGFHTIILHPVFDRRLGSLDLRYQSPYGEIHSSWSVDGNKAHWTVTIPPNASGWLSLTAAEAASYTLNAIPLEKPAEKDGKSGYELEAGTYRFEVTGVK